MRRPLRSCRQEAVDLGTRVEQGCQRGPSTSEFFGIECGREGPGVLQVSDLVGEGRPPRAGGAEEGSTEGHLRTRMHILDRGRITHAHTREGQERAIMKERIRQKSSARKVQTTVHCPRIVQTG